MTWSLVSVADLRVAEFGTFVPGYCGLFCSGYQWDSNFIGDGDRERAGCRQAGPVLISPVQLDVPLNAPEAFVNMDSAGFMNSTPRVCPTRQ